MTHVDESIVGASQHRSGPGTTRNGTTSDAAGGAGGVGERRGGGDPYLSTMKASKFVRRPFTEFTMRMR